MNIYTVSFFGHRYIERGTEIENRLDKLLHDLITQKEYVDFLIGRDGDFDLLASAAIKRAIRSHGYGNTHFTLVLPYRSLNPALTRCSVSAAPVFRKVKCRG